MSGTAAATWEILDWDSEFFGFRIARAFAAPSEAALASTVAECARQQVRCLYFLAEAGDIATIRMLEQQAFQFADLRFTMIQQSLGNGQSTEIPGIRAARAEDVPVLQRIARISHHNSRFYADANFQRERCDALYDTWITKSCAGGFANVVYVAPTAGDEAGGYITCAMIQPDRGQIGLLAVAPELRGSGVGGRLIRQALSWAQSRGATSVITVTQGASSSAVRTYERCGFVAERMQLWYHRWFDAGAFR
jgi:dTDP-4-amino-4,6-dideoxy-D-galactose acyltransferase